MDLVSDDCLQHVMTFLTARDRLNLAETCRRAWRAGSTRNERWTASDAEHFIEHVSIAHTRTGGLCVGHLCWDPTKTMHLARFGDKQCRISREIWNSEKGQYYAKATFSDVIRESEFTFRLLPGPSLLHGTDELTHARFRAGVLEDAHLRTLLISFVAAATCCHAAKRYAKKDGFSELSLRRACEATLGTLDRLKETKDRVRNIDRRDFRAQTVVRGKRRGALAFPAPAPPQSCKQPRFNPSVRLGSTYCDNSQCCGSCWECEDERCCWTDRSV